MSGCEFGLCARPAEFEVDVPSTARPDSEDTIRVCGLHVTPVVTWGVAEPDSTRVRYLQTSQPPLPGLDELGRRRGQQEAA